MEITTRKFKNPSTAHTSYCSSDCGEHGTPAPAPRIEVEATRQYTKVAIPERIWIDTEGLSNAYARGYDQYFLAPYPYRGDGGDGPSDGQSIEYVQRETALREAACLMCQFCKQSGKYGDAERDPEHNLFAHKKNGARYCNAENIQRALFAALRLAGE